MTPKGPAVASKLPFNTNYRCRRVQSIYTASDISAVCLNGRLFNAIQLKITAFPSQPMMNFRLEFAFTKEVSLKDSWLETKTCYGPKHVQLAHLPKKDNWVTFALDPPIEWDRESNLVLQFYFEGNAVASDRGTTAAVNTGQEHRTRSYATDDEFDSKLFDKTSSSVPCLRLQFTHECAEVTSLSHAAFI